MRVIDGYGNLVEMGLNINELADFYFPICVSSLYDDEDAINEYYAYTKVGLQHVIEDHGFTPTGEVSHFVVHSTDDTDIIVATQKGMKTL